MLFWSNTEQSLKFRDFWAKDIIASIKPITNHGQKYARILQLFLFWERYLAVRPNSNILKYCKVYCITSIIQHESFYSKNCSKNFEEQVKRFFQRHKWQFRKKKLSHPV